MQIIVLLVKDKIDLQFILNVIVLQDFIMMVQQIVKIVILLVKPANKHLPFKEINQMLVNHVGVEKIEN